MPNARRFILYAFLALIVGLSSARADNLRSVAELHKELVELDAKGLHLSSFNGLSRLKPELLLNDELFMTMTSELHDFIREEDTFLKTRFSHISRAVLTNQSIRARAYVALVELLRQGLISGDHDLITTSLMETDLFAIDDSQLALDIAKIGLATPDSRTLELAQRSLKTLLSGMFSELDDSGQVGFVIQGRQTQAALSVGMMLARAFQDIHAPDSTQKMQAVAKLTKRLGTSTLSPEAWEILIQFRKRDWAKASLEQKKAYIEFLDHHTLDSGSVASRLLALDEANRSVPYRLSLLKIMRSFLNQYPAAIEWMRPLLNDQSLSVVLAAAESISYSANRQDYALIRTAFEKQKDPVTKGRLALSLVRYWEHQNRQPGFDKDEEEKEFIRLAQQNLKAAPDVQRSVGRALYFWSGIAPVVRVQSGISEAYNSCEGSLAAKPTLAEPDIWLGE